MATMNAAWNLQNNPELQKAAKNYQAHLDWVNKQKVNQRGTLQKYAPAAGATAGALLAAVLTRGASIAPTMAALGAAGAIGGGAGEAYAQKSNKENFNLGRIRNEALVSGATSAIPVGGFGRSARIASQAGTSAATAGAEQVIKKGLAGKVQQSGIRMASRSAGIGPGERIAGKELQTPVSQKLYLWGKQQGMPSGHPEVVNTWANTQRDTIGKHLEGKIAQTNVRIKPTQVSTDFHKAIQQNASIRKDPQAVKLAANIEASIKQVKTNKGLVQARRDFQDAINQTRGTGVSPKAERVHQIAVNTLEKHINNVSPEIKAINGEYNKISKIVEGSAKQTQRVTRQSENAGGGLAGRILTGDSAQTFKSITGGVMARTPSNTVKGAAAGLLRPTAGEFGKQSLTQAILNNNEKKGADPYAPQPPAEVNPATNTPNGPYDPNYVAPTPNPTAAPNADPNAPTDQTQQQAPESPYSLQQALADIQRDPKNTDKYLSVYKTVAAAQKEAAKAAGGQGHGIISAQSYSNARSGAESLQQLAQMIQDNPSLTTKTSSPGQGLPVVGGYVEKSLGTNSYNALARNVADAVLRLRTGAQANESEIRLYMKKFLPAAGDSPADVQRKLQILQSNFTPYLSSGGPTDLSSLTDALTAVQGGQ